jgi:tRNA1(Val) A37 N6-methylase TrmN6
MSDLQEIYVLNKRLKLLHTAEGFKTSIDSVLLAASCPTKSGQYILDLGCGVGGAGLSVLTRVEGIKLTGVEIQEDHVNLAVQNAQNNDFADQCDFIQADVAQYKSNQAFDHVISNPPYLESGAHLRSPSNEKATAMGFDEANLKEWINIAYKRLKPDGTLAMIHRADHMDKIIQDLGERFGAVEIFPLWPKLGVPAKRVIIRAKKDRKTPATLHAGLTLHQENGEYTDEANKVFKDLNKLF